MLFSTQFTMLRLYSVVFVVLYYFVFFNGEVNCNELFLKSTPQKRVPDTAKRNRNTNNADFEKFFLKASKSVPRIGRTGNALQQVHLLTFIFS